jgi:hypothetical protein
VVPFVVASLSFFFQRPVLVRTVTDISRGKQILVDRIFSIFLIQRKYDVRIQTLKTLGIEIHLSGYVAALIVFLVVGIIVAAQKAK